MPKPIDDPVPVGAILILRAEMEEVASTPEESQAKRLRARRLTQLLDEVLDYRQKEARNAASAQQAL
jgi:hypothetical protein